MAVELATGYISLAVSAKGLGRDIGREFTGVEKQADKSGKKAGGKLGAGVLSGVKAIGGPIAALFAADQIVGFFKEATGEAREAQKVGAVTAQVIKATGGAAKLSAGQIGELATAISNKTGMDDEAIQSGANLLLTFKNVRNEVGAGNDVFSRATAAAADLAAAGFGSIEGASKMLGKALNDPIKGISALSRAGVTFTDQQKEQIKTLVASGDTLGAQRIIMGEVESQVGGVAAASATAGEKLSVAFGNFKEQVGTALLPIIDQVATILTTRVIPSISGFVTGMQEGTGAGGKFVAGLKTAGAVLKSVGGFIAQNRDVIIPLVAALAAGVAVFKTITTVVRIFTGVQAALNVVMALNPIGLVVVALAALVTGLVVAYKRSETFRNVVNAAWAGIKTAAKAVFDWLSKAVVAVIDFVKTHWKTMVAILAGPIGVVVLLITKHWGKIKAGFSGVLRWVTTTFKTGWNRLKEAMLAPIRLAWTGIKATLEKVRATFRDAVSNIGRVWAGLKAKAKEPISFIINTVINRGLIGAFNEVAKILPGVDPINPVSVPGFHSGGWTGPGSKYQPAGIVHADEFVINKASRRRIERDSPGLLDRLNGYAKGGLVGGSGRFSPLFESRLMLASQMANTVFHIFQRGFRPATSYSGTSHQGDAVDLAPITTAVIKALRSVGVAAWDRTGMGNWAPHIHGVPTPGAGYAAGSAIWQAQDYLRGGDGLGGRDNGPRVGVLGKIGAFIKSGFASFSEWFGNLVKDPLAKLKSITGSPLGQLAAGVPRMLVEGMRQKVSVFDQGGRLQPGLTFNGTRRSELVLNRPQERVVEKALDVARGGGGLVIQGGVHGASEATVRQLARELDTLQRRRQALQPAFV